MNSEQNSDETSDESNQDKPSNAACLKLTIHRHWPLALFLLTVTAGLTLFFRLSATNFVLTHIHDKGADGLLNATQFYEVNEMHASGELSTAGLLFDNEHRLDDHQHPFGQMFIFPPYQSLLHQILGIAAIKATPESPFTAAFNAQLIFSFLANFWVVWLVLVRLKIPRVTALVGALIPSISAYIATSALLGHVQNVAFWPLVLVAYNAARLLAESDLANQRRTTLVRAVYLGLSLFALVAITPQYLFFTLLIVSAALPLIAAVMLVTGRGRLPSILGAAGFALVFGAVVVVIFGYQSMSPSGWYDSMISFYRIRTPNEILKFKLDASRAVWDSDHGLFCGRVVLFAHLLIIPLAIARFRAARRTGKPLAPLSAGAWFAVLAAILAVGGIALAEFAEWKPGSLFLYRINVSGRVYTRAAPMALAVTSIGALVLFAHGLSHLSKMLRSREGALAARVYQLTSKPIVVLSVLALVILVIDTPLKSPIRKLTRLDKYENDAHRELRSRNEPSVAVAEQGRDRKIAFGAFGGSFAASTTGMKHGLSGYGLYCTNPRFLPTHIAHDGKYVTTDWSNPACTKLLSKSPLICSQTDFTDRSFLFETCTTRHFDHWRKPLLADVVDKSNERTLVAGQRYFPIVQSEVGDLLRKRWALLGAGYENDAMLIEYRWQRSDSGSISADGTDSTDSNEGDWVVTRAGLHDRPVFVHLEGTVSYVWLMGPPLFIGSGLRKGKGVDVPFEPGAYQLEIRITNETTEATSTVTASMNVVRLAPASAPDPAAPEPPTPLPAPSQ